MKSTLLASSMILSSLVFAACAAEDDADVDTTAQEATSCTDVAIITARASTEAAGEGITGALVTQIINSSKQTVSRASVNYPATLTNYASSSLQGINALKSQLTTQVQNCPSSKVVLLGYSQGAHVVLDTLVGGQGGSLGTAVAAVPSNISSHVAALASFGDPRHVTGQSFDIGTSNTNGLFPRTSAQLSAAKAFASRVHAWCDANDEFCSSGASLQVHLTYLNRYQNAAASFVLGLVGG